MKVQAVKYLYKYIYKGSDKAETTVESKQGAPDQTVTIDEIKEHIDNRYVSTIEAIWHFFSFPMNHQDPPIIRLEMHLEDEQNIVFSETNDIKKIEKDVKHTKLTAWFHLNQTEPEARKYLYPDLPRYYIWKSSERKWQKRKFNKVSNMIGRIYFISPRETERFAMRILLLNTPGVTSFSDLRTVDGTIFCNYQTAAINRGLLHDDKIWNETLTEASLTILDTQKIRLIYKIMNFKTIKKNLKYEFECRSLFAMILFLGNPSDPGALWEEHKISLAHDYILSERARLQDQYLQYNLNIQNLTIMSLNEELESYNVTTASFFGLPVMSPNFKPNIALNDPNYINNQYISDHLAYDKDKLANFAQKSAKQFNKGQKDIYDIIMNKDSTQRMYFIDGPGN